VKEVLLGFEIGSAEPVFLKPGHAIVTGITQRSGKTTTLEGLIRRSELKAIAFKTKPGEAGFSVGRIIPPFFIEHSNWQYVESLMGAVMGQKMKFERSWIIRACKGAQTLEDVDRNILNMMKKIRESSLDYSVFTSLHAYFDIVLPQLKDAQLSRDLTLHEGVNIMDLERYSDELQSLVIRSVVEWVLRNERNTVVIIPEAWKFVPEGRGTPAKMAVEMLIRQGAARGNFVWFDSQDLAGTDKGLLKQVTSWILGLQLERNEVEHTLDQIPLPNSMKPSADKVMTLKVGHFFVCTPDFTKQVYVLPSWLPEDIARKIAKGELAVEQVMDKKTVKIDEISYTQDAAIASMRAELNRTAKQLAQLQRERDDATDRAKRLQLENERQRKQRAVPIEKYNELKGVEARYNRLLNSIKKLATSPELQLFVGSEPASVDSSSGSMEFAAPRTPMRVVPTTAGGAELNGNGSAGQSPPQGMPMTLTIPPEKNMMLQKLGGAPRKIYEVLLQHPNGLTKAQIGLMTGYAYTSGSFSNAISKLRTMGLIKSDGDLHKVV
jgi:hypothetical protein